MGVGSERGQGGQRWQPGNDEGAGHQDSRSQQTPDKRTESSEQRQQRFLDLLMPLYPKALSYAQAITGSLIDGEDLLQDAVLRAYQHFDKLRQPERFREWFYSILLNRFRNLRSRQLLRPLTLVAEFAEPQQQRSWEATARSSDPAEFGYQLTLVKELLSRLAPREREVVMLLGPTGLSVDEVAAIQKVSRRAVIQCLYRARQKLLKMLPEGELLRLGLSGAVDKGGIR
jgi:RNA polymerase sigma-70 factor (ECF subfamily)